MMILLPCAPRRDTRTTRTTIVLCPVNKGRFSMVFGGVWWECDVVANLGGVTRLARRQP